MQRTLSIESRIISTNGTIAVPMVNTIADDWGGNVTGRNADNVIFSSRFSDVVSSFQNRQTINVTRSTPCENCIMTVQVCALFYYLVSSLTVWV